MENLTQEEFNFVLTALYEYCRIVPNNKENKTHVTNIATKLKIEDEIPYLLGDMGSDDC